MIYPLFSTHLSELFKKVFHPNFIVTELTNFTMDVSCPPLIPPDHGYLECSTNKQHIANWPGSQCVLRCPNGFRVIGRYSKVCGNDGKWIGSGDGACIRKFGSKRILKIIIK